MGVAPSVGSKSPPGPRVAGRRGPPLVLGLPAPWIFASLITLILVVGEWTHQILGGYERLLLAHATAYACEIVCSRSLRGRWPNLLSAYITANSVAILVKPGALWPFALIPALAIVSKYVLAWRGRHLWNPTNFAITAALTLAPGSVAILSHEWGNDPAFVLLVFGIGAFIVQRAGLLHISGTYAVAFAVLAVPRAWIAGTPVLSELAPLSGAMYQLLMFFMLTDPRTVVSSKRGRVIVVLLIALLEALFRLSDLWHAPWLDFVLRAPPLYALAIVGPIAMVVDLARKR